MNRGKLALFFGLVFSVGLAMAQQPLKLTLGHSAAPGNPRHEASLKFVELLRQRSGGRIQVQVLPSAQAGDDATMVAALRAGSLDITANSQGAVSAAVPEYSAFGMPFLFQSLPHAWKVLDGPAGQELAEKSADKGLVVLGYWDNGFRHMSNNKRPLLRPEDLRGLKMRTPPDPVTVDIMKALGAEAHQIKFAELHAALQQGVVDGQENPLMNIHASRLYEVQKFITLTGHKYEMTPFLMGKSTWDRLSEGDRLLVAEASREATALQRRLSLAADERVLAELKAKGVRIDPVNRGPFEKATSAVDDMWIASPIGPFVKKVIVEKLLVSTRGGL